MGVYLVGRQREYQIRCSHMLTDGVKVGARLSRRERRALWHGADLCAAGTAHKRGVSCRPVAVAVLRVDCT